VEVGEERIVGFLQHDRRVEPRAQTLRQGGFAGADRTFYRDVAERQCGANDIIAPMRIERLELRLLKLPLVHFFETSFGRIDDKHFILVRVDDGGVSGYGECVAEQDPYYSAETNETAWHIIADFIAPRVLGVDFAHPRDVFPALKAIRGHNMAKAAVEMAAWDLHSRQRGEPLARVLGGARHRIASGVSIGIQPSPDDLAAKI